MVFCPPHPLFEGSHHDRRLSVLREVLLDNVFSVFSMDYGSYGGGKEEVGDVEEAVTVLREEVEKVALLGYSCSAVWPLVCNPGRSGGFWDFSILEEVDQLRADFAFYSSNFSFTVSLTSSLLLRSLNEKASPSKEKWCSSPIISIVYRETVEKVRRQVLDFLSRSLR